jgi:hypothetical protein
MVLIAGGFNCNVCALASAELYNPATGTFTYTGNLGTARGEHTATLLNNGMVLIAGGVGNSAILTGAELYDPTTGSFTYTTGSMNTVHPDATATLLNNGMVLIAGGYNSSGAVLASAELYNPANGIFTLTGSLNTARYSHTATLLNNGTVLIAGGYGNSGVLASAELYEPSTLTPPNLMSIDVTPATSTLSPGTTQQFIATGTFSDSSTEQLASVTWSSSNSAVAEISNDASNHGMDLAIAAGTATISAAAGSVSGSGTLTVRPTGFVYTGSLNTGRYMHTATLLTNGMALIAGGSDQYSNGLASAELYNPANGGTFALTTYKMNYPRFDGHTATLLNNGEVLIAGGAETYGGGYLPYAELYNPANETFTLTTSDMNNARYYHTATLLNNGMVLIAGGSNTSGYLNTAELYNPANQTFTLTGNLQVARAYHTATLLPNGMVLIAGGCNSGVAKCTSIGSAELYNPSTGAFTLTTYNMNTARVSHTATLLPNGMVLMAGGYNTSSGYLNTAELYNPANQTFTLTTYNMNSPREFHTATLLDDGMVLIAGGSYFSSLASAELYNPANETFTLTGSLNTARQSHTATPLPNGMVLMAGGYNSSSGVLASAELY